MLDTPPPAVPGVASNRTRRASQARAVTSGPVDLAALEGTPPLVVAGLAAALSTYAARVRVQRPGHRADVLLADLSHRPGPLRMPVVSSPLVVLVRDGDATALAQARAAGADPVTLAATADLLVRTVETAFRRDRTPQATLPPDGGALLVDPAMPLSPREVQVLDGICAGLSNVEIAAELYVSINSVKTYVRSAYRKMGVERRGQAVVWGMQRGYGVRGPAGG